MIAVKTGQADRGKGNSAGAQSSGSSGPAGPRKYKIIKDGWGSRSNFQFSYGLKMTPDDMEEGNRILEGMQKLAQGENPNELV